MAELKVLAVAELPSGAKRVVKAGNSEILMINDGGRICAVEAKCPHAEAPLVEGAVCDGRIVCPWHLATFALPSGELIEPPAMRPLRTYKTRSDGDSIFVDSEPEVFPASTKTGEGDLFLLVGLGAAGTMALATLRQAGFVGKIVVVEPNYEEPVDRTQLSKDALGGKMPLKEIRLDVPEASGVERINGSIVKLDTEARRAYLNDGTNVNFDKALIATGSSPKRLPIPGAELAHVIRHSADVERILAEAKAATHVVILGTSFIAMEAASALVQSGLDVTVVGREKLPFSRQFGDAVAQTIRKWHLESGTKFRLGVEVGAISEAGVMISENGSETEVPADLVVMGVGVSPEIGFTHNLPIDQKTGGIRTDKSLHAAHNIWVAGDIANIDGARIEHWRVAQQHGRTAALGMLSKTASYEGPPFFWTYHFGKRLGYLGHAKEWDRTEVKGALSAEEFMVFYVMDSKIEAVLSCGFETQMAALAEPMRSELSLEDALGIVA